MPYEQLTITDWTVFLVSMGLTIYAFWHLITGLLARGRAEQPAAAERPAGTAWRLPWPLRVLAWVGDVSITYVYAPLGRGLANLARALWVGPTVSTVSSSATADYVTSGEEEAPTEPPSSLPSVRPSAETAPDLPPALAGITVDRSRESLILALVAAGWNTEQIRAVISGANAKIGEEVKAARERLAAGEALTPTPIAERPTAAEFRQN